MSAQQDEFELDFDDESNTGEVQTVNAAGQGETTVVEAPVNDANEGDEVLVDDSTDGEQVGGEQVELTDEQKAEADAKAKAEAAVKAKAEEDERNEALAKFQEHVNGLFDHEDYDKLTGTLPEVLTQSVVDEYAKLPGAKGKAAGRGWLESSMQESMVKGATDDPSYFMRARTFMELNTKVTKEKATKGTAAAKPKVDPTEAHVERIAAMMLAPNLVPVAADVTAGWEAKAEELVSKLGDDTAKYRDWLALEVKDGEDKPEAPEVNPVVVAAAKIALGRAATTRKASTSGGTSTRPSTAGSGHQGHIEPHLREVMDSVEVGTFLTIAEIVNKETSQYGGSAPKPSPGAVAARLFPTKGECNLDFVRPEGKDEGRPVKGAVRIK
jgi:hypothetical protein